LDAALRREGIDEPTAQAVLGRLAEVGLVNDEAFAESFVHSGHAHQGLGRRALAVQLRRRGVDEATTSTALSALDTAAEERRARELVRRRLPAMATADEATAIRRLVGLLARKGYSPGLSYRVLREELREAGRDVSLLDDPVLAEDECPEA
jgi:regulatory protein